MLAQRCRRCRKFFEAASGSVCDGCAPAVAKAQAAKKQHHQTDRSRMIAVAAYAEHTPGVVCCLCQRREPPPGYDGLWTGEHVEAGVAGSEILPAHRGCNSARGNRSVEWFRTHIGAKFPGWFGDAPDNG